MDPTELRGLVGQGEGVTVEFKRSTGELREAVEALCGMLNGSGFGRVLFGVTNAGEVVGQDVAEKTLADIANESRKLEPKAEITTHRVVLPSGRTVVVVEARAVGPGPFTYDGRPYLRVDLTTQQMSRSEFDQRVAERLLGQKPWDGWPAQGWRLADLDAGEIGRAVRDAVATERLSIAPGEQPEQVLRRLELLTADELTRAAVILFGDNDRVTYPIGQLRLARFAGTTKDEFVDNRQFDGNAFHLLDVAERFLREGVPVASRFVPGQMARIDIPKYPPLAVREALINGLIHRDYAVGGGALSVAIFDDRLEVWSTGTLPPGMTVAKLKGTHESVPRNPLVATVFHRRGLIERWGRGTNKIIEECERAGCPEPEFEETGLSVVVRFRPRAVPTTHWTTTVLGPRAERILQVLGRRGPLHAPELLRELAENVTLRSLQTDLRALRDAGRIVMVGRGRATEYHLAVREGNGSAGMESRRIAKNREETRRLAKRPVADEAGKRKKKTGGTRRPRAKPRTGR
jgi:ATP-dependent DNA helicase RecG